MLRRKWGRAALVLLMLSASMSSVRPGASDVPPNIVLILTDDQTFESLAQMPYTNGRTDWIRFSNASTNNPLCCPSRASILTGQESHHHNVEDNNAGDLLDESSTIATWLNAYESGMFGKYLNGYPFGRGLYVPAGWDRWWVIRNNSGPYYDYKINDDGVARSFGSTPADYSTDMIHAKAVSFVQTAPEPFFAYVSPPSPHEPTTPAPRHELAFQGTPVERPASFNEEDVSDKPAWVRSRSKYNGAVQDEDRRETYRALLSVDEMIAGLFDALSARGVLERTVVVFLSDHGFAFGEHRYRQKRCPYEACIQTPLLIRYPGQPGRTVSELVSNLDLASTFAELAGVTPPATDGMSLVPLIEGTAGSWPNEVLLRNRRLTATDTPVPSFFGIRTLDYKYIEYGTGERELYDLILDPDEMQNVADTPAYASVQASLAARLQILKQ
jgi:arylsulfatase A-like enzyme